ncbi:helicase-like transcription factor isoform X2 [Mercenaria mercenaria]|uniref:helicase-like transcription factor isoform X2 n=1 Tax=Mercenaria mercenaria TaxID=6596 RepID=UPI00234E4233|nr:helicase-like transcription factor isoform X2 [Mercenaria mercenaria]
MGRGWWRNSSSWGWKKRRSWGSSFPKYNYDQDDSFIDQMLAERYRLALLERDQILGTSSQASQSVVDDNDDDEMGRDDLDDEICFGSLRGNIVGLQYYSGTVNKKEMVALEREPQNRYDINAIKVKNVGNVQVGHIKRELAKPLAFIMDRGLARLEGVVPFGAQNMYSMPVEISLWGKPENQQASVDKLKKSGFYLTGGTQPATSNGSGASSSLGATDYAFAAIQPRRTYLTPAEVKNELDKLFENIQEGDKTSLADPAQAIATPLYPHQKQALNWMIKRENSATLPPFWQERNGRYFNTVLNFTSNTRPESVRGGILADDMGLGKTLEMITLIVTNFVDNNPLANPVEGLVRQSKADKMALQKSKMLPTSSSVNTSVKRTQIKLEKVKSLSCHTEKHFLSAVISPDNIDTPALPSLPDDEEAIEISDDDDDDEEEELAGMPTIDDKTMLRKDDPDFSPVVKKKAKKTKAKENVTPEETSALRPRRSVKRPARYTYSSEEDEAINDETPKKRVKENVLRKTVSNSAKGKAPLTGKKKVKKGKPKKCLLEDEQKQEDSVENLKDNTNRHTGTEESASMLKESASSLEDPACKSEDPAPKVEDPVSKSESAVVQTAANTGAGPADMMSVPVFNSLQPEAAEAVKKMSDRIKELEALLSSQQVPASQPIQVGSQDLTNTSATQPSESSVPAVQAQSVVIDTVTIKQELSKTSITVTETGDHKMKDACDDLPDLDEILCTNDELPDIQAVTESGDTSIADCIISSETVLPSNYTKAEMRETGESTGRAASAGPRCTLIVCPLSVLSNWLDQLDDHVHRNVHLSIYLYYGSGRTKNSNLLENQDVVITTYSTVSADFKKGVRNPLKKVKWLRIVLDEGHAIKNPSAQQTKAILELDAQRKWVLTGTPIQNSMKDLWSLINFLKVNPFTDKQWWRRTIERPLEKGDESALKRVQHLMGHLALRRTKTQEVNGKPLVELPERKVYIEHVKLSEDEKKVYDSMQNEGKLIVSKYFKQGTLLHHYGDVLAILMRLRQLCCHPFLVAKAAQAVKDTIAEIDRNGGVINDELRQKLIDTLIMVLSSGTDEECAICLDSLKSPVITHCAHVFCRPCIESVIKNERPNPKCPLCRGAIEDNKLLEVPPEEIQGESGDSNSIAADTWKSSAKVDALMNGLLKLRSEDPSVKSIVVSQFTSLLTLLEIPLRTNGFNFVRLDGTMSTKARTRAIEEFSDPSSGSPTIFLLSLKAGGVGINLTAASRVFLIDPAWNPASEEQCFDRCHRLGQTKDVIITKLIVEDSVEERMMELQEKKRQLMQGAFGQKQNAEQKRQARIRDIKTLFSF